MPFYRSTGQVPPKRHTLFTGQHGEQYFEEFIGQAGFSGTGSLLYHTNVPSSLVASKPWDLGDLTTVPNRPLKPRHFRLPELFPQDIRCTADTVQHRRLILGNGDVRISYVVAEAPSPLYQNSTGDEVVFVERGAAMLETIFGTVLVEQGDNVVIPSAVIHRWLPQEVDSSRSLHLYIVEADGHVAFPRKYLNSIGQFLEGSPLTERDIRTPQGPLLADHGAVDTEVYVKHRSSTGVEGSIFVYDHHPFDVVAWDGYLYPYAFNYRDFSPVTGHILQPPTTYQLFEGSRFVVCNFVPRTLESHPLALKVPYYHANVDSDEVMFYFMGETAARRGTGIGNASVSLHPAGYTHGPTRDAYLASSLLTRSDEVAFMLDAFGVLEVGEGGIACDDPQYAWSWSGRGPDQLRETL